MKHLHLDEIIKRLTNPKRFEIEPTHKVWSVLKEYNPKVILEIGAGTGYYTHVFAKNSSSDTKIIACDILKELLVWLIKHAPCKAKGKILPLHISQELPIKKDSIDLIFMANLHHELESGIKLKFLKELKNTLKRQGIMAVVDWKDVPSPIGPPIKERLKKEEIEHDLKHIGMKSIYYYSLLPFHHFFISHQ